jgi:hypothetical protein
MAVFNYIFENKEDREMAFLNIVKWYGTAVVEKVESLGLSIRGTHEVLEETRMIIEKHAGQIQSLKQTLGNLVGPQ